MMFPAFPVFGAGSNGKIAWGLTNMMADHLDLYLEKINPDNPNQYLYKGKWVDFETVSGKIKVRKKPPVPYSYRRSRHYQYQFGKGSNLPATCQPNWAVRRHQGR